MGGWAGAGGGGVDGGLGVVAGERRQLVGVAYRLLGSLAEAEDAVQEAYARWYALTGRQRDAVGSPGGWLATVTSRICLDLLGSARARRERYVGEWVPEPLPGPARQAGGAGGAGGDPADRVTLDESVTMAFLVVLESLSPAGRVALILHDVFGYPFTEVAQITGRTPAACRQLASSARRRIRAAQPPAVPPARQAGLVREFKNAWQAQDIGALIALLDPDATVIADGGGLAQRRARPDRRRRADRPVHHRPRHPGTRQRDVAGTHGQRPARPDRPARRRHRHRVRVRAGGRPDQAHLGRTQPPETPALDGLTPSPGGEKRSDSGGGCPTPRPKTAPMLTGESSRGPLRSAPKSPPAHGPFAPTPPDAAPPVRLQPLSGAGSPAPHRH